MTKQEYFKIVKKITKKLRDNKVSYCRVFSEARPTMNGYKTKIWHSSRSTARIINNHFGDLVVAKSYESPQRYLRGSIHVEITPLEEVVYDNSNITSYVKQKTNEYGTKGYLYTKKFKQENDLTQIELDYLLK